VTINNRALQGQPTLPYADFRSYAGEDVFANVAFVDAANNSVVPLTIVFQIDDLTNAQNMVPQTSIPNTAPTVYASAMRIQLPASYWNMTFPYQGSQICQISWTYTATDVLSGSVYTGRAVNVVELCAIQTPQNGG
jgi:hypothetical protein